MRIVAINSTNYGSTGNIMLQIADAARKEGHTVLTCCPSSRSNRKKQIRDNIYIGSIIERNIHIHLNKWTGLHGCFSIFSTWRFLKKIDKFKPDIFHLHNLHNCYINLPMLFKYIKKHSIKTVWTLHDCWSFTGQCPYFSSINCDKWKTGCFDCPQINIYPVSKVDQTRKMWKRKRGWFSGVENLTVVTPSEWLASLVKQSFLKDYPVKVINNGIDLDVFKPTESGFRKEHHLENRFILLGVAFAWGYRKGIDVFVELSKRLDDHYSIVLVGTNDETDDQLPDDILTIHTTDNQYELAKIYSAADLFVNPTREDNYPTVNMESIACGTPVLTFRTGGSPEIPDDKTGCVVSADDVDGLTKQIIRISTEKPYNQENCKNRALAFDKTEKYREYLRLYLHQ